MNRRKNSWVILIIIIVLIAIKAMITWRNDANNGSTNNQNFRNISHLSLTKHVRCRMECRHITIDEIKEIMKDGNENVAKSGKGSKGDMTYALEGYSGDHQHIRVLVAPKNNEVVVITCIDLDKEWPCHCN